MNKTSKEATEPMFWNITIIKKANIMNAKTNNFDINLNAGTSALAGASVASNKQTDYINLNCYIQRAGDESPEWVFRASCVPTTRKATESILNKIAIELLEKQITFSFIEGNMKKEKEEMEELF